MRSIVLHVVCLVAACAQGPSAPEREPVPSAERLPPAPRPAPVDLADAADTNQVSRDLPSARPTIQLAVPTEGRPPKRAKSTGSRVRPLVDCAAHEVWQPPEGWDVLASNGKQFAWNADLTAVVVRTRVRHDDVDAPREIAARVASADVSYGPSTTHRKNKYRIRTQTDGTATADGVPIAVHIERRWQGKPKDLVWIQVAAGPDRAQLMTEMDPIRATNLMLTSHACECGYDCSGTQPIGQ